MLYAKHIEIPEDRSKTNPYTEILNISKGTMRKVIVLMVVPSAWCVGVSLWYSTSQLFPTSRAEWLPGGLVKFEWEENIEIKQPPLELEVRCYNEDTQNKHKVWVGVNIVRSTASGRLLDFLRFFQGTE